MGWNLDGELAIYHFKAGLPKWLVEQLTTAEVARGGSVSVGVLAKMALQLEAVRRQQYDYHDPTKGEVGKDKKSMERPGNSDREGGARLVKCFKCGKFGHKSMKCTFQPMKDQPSAKTEGANEKGIFVSNPGGPTKENVLSNGQRGATNNTSNPIICYNCGRTGHLTKNCDKTRREPGREVRTIQLVEEKKSTKNSARDATPHDNRPMEGIHTPCIINGVQVTALVDPGAMVSFVDRSWATQNNWVIHPCAGVIKQAISGSEVPRMGEVRGLELWNGEKKLHVTLEAGDLSGGEKIILGLNLFEPLGYQIQNIPIYCQLQRRRFQK